MVNKSQRISIFLDTNTLHHIGLYLEYAKRLNDPMYLYDPDWDDKSRLIESEKFLERVRDPELAKSLKMGRETIKYLQKEEFDVEYSIVSEMELLLGRAKGSVMVKLAEEGVPDRMWSSIKEADIWDRLSLVDMRLINKRIENMMAGIENAGININIRTPDKSILECAKEICGLVYIGSNDSIIYSNALEAEADFIITNDKYFRTTVNRIYHANRQYKEINSMVRDLVDKLMARATPVDHSPLALPRAFTIKANGERQPKYSI